MLFVTLLLKIKIFGNLILAYVMDDALYGEATITTVNLV